MEDEWSLSTILGHVVKQMVVTISMAVLHIFHTFFYDKTLIETLENFMTFTYNLTIISFNKVIQKHLISI